MLAYSELGRARGAAKRMDQGQHRANAARSRLSEHGPPRGTFSEIRNAPHQDPGVTGPKAGKLATQSTNREGGDRRGVGRGTGEIEIKLISETGNPERTYLFSEINCFTYW